MKLIFFGRGGKLGEETSCLIYFLPLVEKRRRKAYLSKMKNCLLSLAVSPSPRPKELMLKLFITVSRKIDRLCNGLIERFIEFN